MTIKEAIGKYKSQQLTERCYEMAAMDTPVESIQICREVAQEFSSGNFIIWSGNHWTNRGKTWMVDTLSYLNTIFDDEHINNVNNEIALSDMVATKIEVAMGCDNYYEEPRSILKLTANDEIYYYDGEEILTIDTNELGITPVEEFKEVDL